MEKKKKVHWTSFEHRGIRGQKKIQTAVLWGEVWLCYKKRTQNKL